MTASDAPPCGDQVVRLEAFRARHPGIEIMTPLDTRSVWWKTIRSGEVCAVENDLRLLLDTLERKLADPWQAWTGVRSVPSATDPKAGTNHES